MVLNTKQLIHNLSMTWKEKIPDMLGRASHAALRSFFLVNGVILALAATYINLRLAWKLILYVNRVWFT